MPIDTGPAVSSGCNCSPLGRATAGLMTENEGKISTFNFETL